MKACPHCGGPIRPSVIKCVHCGMRLVQENEPAGVPTGATVGSDTVIEGSGGGASRFDATGDAAVSTRPVAGSAGDLERATADPWLTPSVRAEEHVRRSMRALPPTKPAAAARVRRIDPTLVVAGVLALAGAVAAASSLALPWAVGRLTLIGERDTTRVVAELVFDASDSIARTVVLAVAAGAGLLGLLWFWYGLDRGAHLPAFAHPAFGLLASAAAWAVVGASRLGAFLWEDAFVARARDAGLTKSAMRAVLEDTDARILAFERQGGVTRLMLAAGIVLAGAAAAWWSQRDR